MKSPDSTSESIPVQPHTHLIPNDADDALDPFEYRLLGHYKRVGHTNEKVRDTAKACQMSTGKVIAAREALSQLGYITYEKSAIHSAGYVYLLRSISGHYKIGHAADPANRLRTFNVKLPFEVEFECIIKTSDMRKLESDFHMKFQHRRVNGEWFSLSSADVEYIKAFSDHE